MAQTCEREMYPNGTTTCRSDAECMALGQQCLAGMPAPLNCGGSTPCPGCFMDMCATDADCMGGICELSVFTQHNVCNPRCTDATCADGERCEADGRCEPVPCDDGFACAGGYRCVPGGLVGDVHGCVMIPCDEPGATPCPYPTSCVSAAPSQPMARALCMVVVCDDARHPGCERNTRCVPGQSPTLEPTGCTRLTCSDDADCDCGTCLFIAGAATGTCHDHIGTSQPRVLGGCPP